MNDIERLFSIKEALAHLRISRATLHRMTKARKIGCVRVGKKVFFTSRHIEDFIQKSSVLPKK